MIIFCLFPIIGLDGAANLVQEVHGHFAGGAAQVVEDGGGGKFGDAGKVLILQIVSRVQPTAGQEGVLDAGRQKVPKMYFQIQVVQFFQKTVRYVVSQIMQTVPVNLVDGAAGLLHELIAKVRFLGGAILPLQSLRNSGMVFRPHFPQIGRSRPLDRAGILHIKDVIQMGPAAGVLPNERDALRTGLHPAPHGFIPQFHAGAGGSVRALGIDQ